MNGAAEKKDSAMIALDGMPLAEPSDAQRAEWAEKRHMFWRRRCLEHARRLDALDKRFLALELAVMDIVESRHSLYGDSDWHKDLIDAITRAQILVDAPLVV